MKEHWADGINNIMREQGSYSNPESIVIGVIKSVSPIQIDYGGLPLNENNLLINRQLLDWTERIEVTTSENNEHSHTISNIKHKSCLNIGDSVILYRINEKYVMLGVI